MFVSLDTVIFMNVNWSAARNENMTPSHFAKEEAFFSIFYCDPLASIELLSKHIVMTAAKHKTIAMKSPLLIGLRRNTKAARLIRKGLV